MADLPVIERIRGTRIETGAHLPFIMDNPTRIHFVERGYLDVFVTELNGDAAVGRRYFVARISAGGMGFGVDRIETAARSFGLFAVPSLDTVIIEGEREGVASKSFDIDSINWIDEWISHVSEFLVRDRPPPQHALLLEADPDIPYSSGSALSAQHNDIIWVSANAPMRFIGRDDMVITQGQPLLPVTERTWFELDSDSEVSAIYTPAALVIEQLWSGFDRFGARIIEFAILAEAEAAEAIQTRRRDAHEARRASVAEALSSFSRILGATGEGGDGTPTDASGRTPLQVAMKLVAESCGASLENPALSEDTASPTEELKTLARRSGIRTRRIRLMPGWWRQDGPSLVGFMTGEDGQEKPLGILSDNRGTYLAVDPETGAAFPVNDRTAPGIMPDALTLYAPLPERIESSKTALGFSIHRRWQDLRTLLAVGILGGIVALLTPILTGEILVKFIPRMDIALWTAALGALFLAAFGSAVFEIVRGLALLRIEGPG